MPVKFDSGISITPSEVMEYLYCPRFTYFMNCLDIPQHEEKRYKVLKGREIHQRQAVINKNYLRLKIGVIKKEMLVYLNSDSLHIRGIVDEVLMLSDGTMAPLDYKLANIEIFFIGHIKFNLPYMDCLLERIMDAMLRKDMCVILEVIVC